jgi:hypothetical protein
MDRRSILKGFAMAGVGLAMLSGGAEAQRKRNKKEASALNPKLISGHWSLVSAETVRPDGTHAQPFGSNPAGVAVFAPNGRFSVSVVNPDMPKFASNNQDTGTDEENKAVARGSITYFGTYRLARDGILSLGIEGSSFPNWSKVDQMRMVTSLTANELKWTATGDRGGTAELVWKK